MKIRTYSELSQLPTFRERYQYLKLNGRVGSSTFGFDRYINQGFYNSIEWKEVRRHVILRDLGCDLGISGQPINGALVIHHINPIDLDNLRHNDDLLLDLDNLITTTNRTHNAIHYGDESLLPKPLVVRMPGDTKLW
jgi:hypothetical protein